MLSLLTALYIIFSQDREYYLLYGFVKCGGVLFLGVFLNVQHADFQRLGTDVDFDDVALLDVIGSAGG